MSDIAVAIQEGLTVSRKYSSWRSPQGFAKDSVPWRLWEKAKSLHWDPSDLDFSRDVEDWKLLGEEQRLAVAGLARGFMVGEEGVTLDVLPLIDAMAEENRVEDVMYLTNFAYEEAKHMDFFRKWFDAVDIDFAHFQEVQDRRMRDQGIEPPDPEREGGMFEYELPRVMRRLRTDRSPRAILDASVTYNQFVEGCLALSGYKVWGEIFESFGVMPGLQAGLAHVRVDESRHITYGTYLARRTVAEHPELMDFARSRMYELRDFYFERSFGREFSKDGDAEYVEPTQGPDYFGPNGPFTRYVRNQVERRIQIMQRAVALGHDDAEAGLGAEEEEAGAEEAPIPVG